MPALKLCKVCVTEKPYAPKPKRNVKASGFYGLVCWDCFLVAQRCTRGTLEGRALDASKYKAWVLKNPEYRKNYDAARRSVDTMFKLQGNFRALIRSSFRKKNWSKTTKTQMLLGCTFEEFIAHLQSKFKEGMALENHGDWHIDHIKPCATATSAEELAALFHFTNLQPLWATENLSKGCKYHE